MSSDVRDKIHNLLLTALDDSLKLAAESIGLPACNGRTGTPYLGECYLDELHGPAAELASTLALLMTNPTDGAIALRRGDQLYIVERMMHRLIALHAEGRRERDRQSRRDSVLAYLTSHGAASARELSKWLNMTPDQVGDAVEHWVKLDKIETWSGVWRIKR